MGKIISDRRRHSVLYATIEETVTNKKSKAAATCMYAMPSVWPHNFRLYIAFQDSAYQQSTVQKRQQLN